jgi:hypothetical protein
MKFICAATPISPSTSAYAVFEGFLPRSFSLENQTKHAQSKRIVKFKN